MLFACKKHAEILYLQTEPLTPVLYSGRMGRFVRPVSHRDRGEWDLRNLDESFKTVGFPTGVPVVTRRVYDRLNLMTGANISEEIQARAVDFLTAMRYGLAPRDALYVMASSWMWVGALDKLLSNLRLRAILEGVNDIRDHQTIVNACLLVDDRYLFDVYDNGPGRRLEAYIPNDAAVFNIRVLYGRIKMHRYFHETTARLDVPDYYGSIIKGSARAVLIHEPEGSDASQTNAEPLFVDSVMHPDGLPDRFLFGLYCRYLLEKRQNMQAKAARLRGYGYPYDTEQKILLDSTHPFATPVERVRSLFVYNPRVNSEYSIGLAGIPPAYEQAVSHLLPGERVRGHT